MTYIAPSPETRDLVLRLASSARRAELIVSGRSAPDAAFIELHRLARDMEHAAKSLRIELR